MVEQEYRCANGHTWPYGEPTPATCPTCGVEPPFMIVNRMKSSLSFLGSLKPILDWVLDSQRIGVLALLLATGLAVGFGIGGWLGVAAGILAPLALAAAFRARRTRGWLARLADWASGR